MDGSAEAFERHRPRLFWLAYRMLGSRSDAEDVVQDAYLRWHQVDAAAIRSAAAFLVTLATRLCLDRLRQERVRRALPGLSEGIADEQGPSPEAQYELTEDLSAGLIAVLERLSAQERTAFLLRDVFGYGYAEMARILGKAQPACRQAVHRARVRLRGPYATRW